jgi:hypothetical protein
MLLSRGGDEQLAGGAAELFITPADNESIE